MNSPIEKVKFIRSIATVTRDQPPHRIIEPEIKALEKEITARHRIRDRWSYIFAGLR